MLIRHGGWNSPLIIHIGVLLITSGLTQPAVCIAHKLSLSCNESSSQLSSLWLACQPPVSFSPTHNQKPVNTQTKPQSLGLHGRMRGVEMIFLGFVEALLARERVRGVTQTPGVFSSERVCGGNYLGDPAVDLTPGLGAVCELQSGLAVDFDAGISVNVCLNQYITADLSASGSSATT